jgi:hypothetical protein
MSFRLNYVFLLHSCDYRKRIQADVKVVNGILNDLDNIFDLIFCRFQGFVLTSYTSL